jgi:hypothetical protein
MWQEKVALGAFSTPDARIWNGSRMRFSSALKMKRVCRNYKLLVIPAGVDELSYIRALDSKWDIFSLI